MKNYVPGKRNHNAKNRNLKSRVKPEAEKGKIPHKMRHQPDWVIRENMD